MTQKVYVMLTLNERRKPEEADAANPRADNRFGHIIEMTPPDGDHAAAQFRWEILLKCGDPSVAEVGATFSTATTRNGWFGTPDNLAFDSQGRMWIATDGNSSSRTGRSDGIWVETEGPLRGAHRGISIVFRSVPRCAAVLHARRRNAVRRGPASRSRRQEHLRTAIDALARFSPTCRRARRWSPSPSAVAARSRRKAGPRKSNASWKGISWRRRTGTTPIGTRDVARAVIVFRMRLDRIEVELSLTTRNGGRRTCPRSASLRR